MCPLIRILLSVITIVSIIAVVSIVVIAVAAIAIAVVVIIIIGPMACRGRSLTATLIPGILGGRCGRGSIVLAWRR